MATDSFPAAGRKAEPDAGSAFTTVGPKSPTESVASAVREWPLAGLREWPENPRSIRPERLNDLKQTLAADRAMLWARPLIALPDGTVICGNQRLRAAVELGWETIPAVIVDLDRERARVWALRDNNMFGDWDQPALAELLDQLRLDGVELALTGFGSGEIDRILAGIPTFTDPDNVPPLPTGVPQSRQGEIYQLGRHRLACGDARDGELLRELIGGEPVDMLWTDPPYGVSYTGKTAAALTIANDNDDAEAVLTEALRAVDPLLAPGARFYLATPAGPQGSGFRRAIDQVGWRHHQTLVWVKNSLVLGHSDYHYQHEEILYGWKPGTGRPGRGRHQGSRWYGGHAQSSVFFVDRPIASETHPTIKPVELIARMLRNSSLRGDSVVDLFAGSGSTLVACDQNERRCFAVELDPVYCDVIRARYEELHDEQ
jgi:DNA modification methylase